MKTKLFALAFAILAISSLHTLAQEPGTPLWSYNATNLITTSPAIAPDGTIYIGTYLGLYAITNAGSNKWTFSASVASSSTIASDGTIYFGSQDGNLYALNPDGSQKWVHQFQGMSGSSPALGADGTIYVAAEGRLCAVTPKGDIKWNYFIANEECSPAVAPDGTIYIGNAGGRKLFAVKPEDGTLKWAFDLASSSGNSAAIGADGTVFIGGGGLYAISPNGTNLWVNQTNDFTGSSPVIGKDGTIYVENDDSLWSIKPNGQTNWSVTIGLVWHGPRPVPPAIDSSGMLYYCSSNRVFAITAQGSIAWVFPDYGPYPATEVSPSIGPDGTIYAALGGTLFALKGTSTLANSPWPMYRQNPRHTGKLEHPSLQKITKRPDSNFEFQLQGEVGQTYRIERSTDLSLWTTLTNLVATNPPATFTDLSASNFPATFYRALQQ